MKIKKCRNCGHEYNMPDSFMGRILCEDCDPQMNSSPDSSNPSFREENAKLKLKLAEATGYLKDILAFAQYPEDVEKLAKAAIAKLKAE